MASSSSIASIRPSFGRGFVPMHVRRTWTTLSRAAANLDVINKVLTGHGSSPNGLCQPLGDVLNGPHSVNALVLSCRAVMVGHRRRFMVVDIDSSLDHLRVGIVGTTRRLRPRQQPSLQLRFRDFQCAHGRNALALGFQENIQGLGLGSCSWKTVKNEALGPGGACSPQIPACGW